MMIKRPAGAAREGIVCPWKEQPAPANGRCPEENTAAAAANPISAGEAKDPGA